MLEVHLFKIVTLYIFYFFRGTLTKLLSIGYGETLSLSVATLTIHFSGTAE